LLLTLCPAAAARGGRKEEKNDKTPLFLRLES